MRQDESQGKHVQVLTSDVILAGEFCLRNKQKQLRALFVMPHHLASSCTTDMFEYLHVMLRKVQANNCLPDIDRVLWQSELKSV